MEQREKILNILRKEIPFISETYHVKRVGVFGSFAKNKATDLSDIDIIVEFEKPIGLKFILLATYLEKKLRRRIDLLTPEGINSIRNEKIADDIKRNTIYA